MRILFMGTPDFAVPSLRILLEQGYSIPAIVTVPDKPRGRGQQISFSPIKEFARLHSLPLLQPEYLKDPKFIEDVQSLYPDLIVVVAFRILPKEIYTVPKLGSFNLHASLLPRYRGAAPINWAIIRGEEETGVTTFFLQDKVDTGSIILQARVRIGTEDSAGDVHDKLADVGAEIVLQTVRLIELGKVQTRLQDDTLTSPAPKIFKNDCRIDWNKTSKEIHNLIRGLSPYPSAWTTHNGKMIKIFRSQIIDHQTDQAGAVLLHSADALVIGTGTGAIAIQDIQQEGKRKMGIGEFLRGYAIQVGDRFE